MNLSKYLLVWLLLGVWSLPHTWGQDKSSAKQADNKLVSSTFGGLKIRSIGPAVTSGRVADLAVNPHNHSEYFVAAASGGVWKTVNHGTTFMPVFDREGAYSIGCVTVDPANPSVVWVGTGENNGQRSIAYGDGVYKSVDGGKSWKNMGLKTSEHIGNIAIDPRNSDVVYVAAHGPLWSEGGERGLYKTTDGGTSWEKILEISIHTGINEVVMDPNNPDILYASSWQRRRKVWTFLSGGPESAVYKSTDAGKTWNKIHQGLPKVELGRIGLALSPVNSNVLYAIVEASNGKGGFFRSTNQGASWQKMSGLSTSGNYYQEIIADPHNVDKVFVMDTRAKVTLDGGKTFKPLGIKHMHVDFHAIWINPKDPNHYIMGNDGGVYESWDGAKTWQFKANLPITQFYKVQVDNAKPFYYVYGGTQDNYSLGGPSRTTNIAGIPNSDWFVTNGGDGFESAIDPENPNIVYAQSQYGGLIRYDKQSGEKILIKPMEGKGEPGLRWNWDAPLLISPHKSTRLYFAANKLFKSEDRGNSWEAISGDLSRGIDRNTLPVMGKVWSMDAVAKNRSTSIYGNIVAFDESPQKEGLLYVGTDDGLVHVSDNTGGSWTKYDNFPGVPERTYVNMLLASQYDDQTVYAAFNNHKNGDFKPYLLKSNDRGATWKNMAGNLPERGSVYSIAEDHEDPNLLFVGTEFGLFATVDGGESWFQLKTGLPTVAIRDLAIQREHNDLVMASFGRGFYVLDDYAALRGMSEEKLAEAAWLTTPTYTPLYVQARPLGRSGKGFQGESYFAADNPPFGATFTYYLKESLQTKKEKRQANEKKLAKDGDPVAYPTFEEMRAEDQEIPPMLLFTIMDAKGEVITRMKTKPSTGVKRITWNLRFPASSPVRLNSGDKSNPYYYEPQGPLVGAGTYQIAMGQIVEGVYTELVAPQSFEVEALDNAVLPAKKPASLIAFKTQVEELDRAVSGAMAIQKEQMQKVKYLRAAIELTPDAPVTMWTDLQGLENRLHLVNIALTGDQSLSRREFETPPSISRRVGTIQYGMSQTTSEPTQTFKDAYDIAADEFEPVYKELKDIVKALQEMEKQLEKLGAPYTPGRIPSWERE